MTQHRTLENFSEAFQAFVEEYLQPAGAAESSFMKRARAHFGSQPLGLPILSQSLRVADHPTLQVALDAYLAGPERSYDLIGYTGQNISWNLPSLAQLLLPNDEIVEGPVRYSNIHVAEDRDLPCVHTGLYIIRDGGTRLMLHIRGPTRDYNPRLDMEVMAADRPAAEAFLKQLDALMRRHNAYRGQILSLDTDEHRQLTIRVQPLPPLTRERIILPDGLLDRIERQTVRFSAHADRLLAAGRHLKRGMLLYGRPGTGKTLTAMYLASQMKGRTTLLITGRGAGLLESACELARSLQPATVVLEDVDLIAGERTTQNQGCNALLFELLNQMDGLSPDADILFILTTNRADVLEPALAARPGRIDLALEVPPPDADGRRKMLALYSEGLRLDVPDMETFVQRTEGASGAFIRELMRKAALYAADEGSELVVKSRHLDEALHELVFKGGALTRSLLGVQPAA